MKQEGMRRNEKEREETRRNEKEHKRSGSNKKVQEASRPCFCIVGQSD